MSKNKKEVEQKHAEIAVKAETQIAVNAGPSRGFESEVEKTDLLIPRCKLIQAMAPEMNEGIDGLKVGSLMNSLTKEILPNDIVPVFFYKNYVRFNPRNSSEMGYDANYQPGQLIWQTTDSTDPRVEETKFGPNGEKPLAMAQMNFFCHFPGVAMPIIVTFSKSSYGVGKQLLSLAKFSGGDLFKRKYKLGSAMEKSNGNTFAVLTVSPNGFATDDEYKLCEKWWNEFAMKAKDIAKHSEEVIDDTLPDCLK